MITEVELLKFWRMLAEDGQRQMLHLIRLQVLTQRYGAKEATRMVLEGEMSEALDGRPH